ncbi:hypothetical protein FHG87_022444 [Trinorchestia longiramus]|nr:hypothetical protein FHG87_022444 [Trinorchestia longiramus]
MYSVTWCSITERLLLVRSLAVKTLPSLRPPPNITGTQLRQQAKISLKCDLVLCHGGTAAGPLSRCEDAAKSPSSTKYHWHIHPPAIKNIPVRDLSVSRRINEEVVGSWVRPLAAYPNTGRIASGPIRGSSSSGIVRNTVSS